MLLFWQLDSVYLAMLCDVLIERVELLCRCILLEQLAGDLPLGSQYDAILSEYT
jgi:hypothetical protein